MSSTDTSAPVRMKAIVCTRYGPPEVLQIRKLPIPVPKDDEVLIRIYATTVHIGDTRIRKADPFLTRLVFGLIKPRKNLIPGMEIAGKIVRTGSEVTSFNAGDDVFAFTGFGLGGYAEYICLPALVKPGKHEQKGLVAIKPANLGFAEAAAVPAGGITALKNLQKAKVRRGQKVLVNGASGSLGTYAVQLARHFGAEVTAVCRSRNEDLVRSLGAEHFIDYTRADFTKQKKKYDIIYDAVMKSSRARCRKVLSKDGIFLNNRNLPKISPTDLRLLKDLIEKDFLKPVIDRSYSMKDIVKAHRYVDQGHKKGNVCMILEGNQEDLKTNHYF